MLPAYVINLDRDKERWARMERLGTEHGITWSRVVAVDKRDPAISERAQNMRPNFYGSTIGPGAVACFESHRKIWRMIASSEAPYAVIFEDDVHISDQLREFLSSLDWIPPDADIVRLETRLQRAKLGRGTGNDAFGRRVARLMSTQMGTAAYLISRRTAEQLLPLSENFCDAVDEFLFSELSPHFHRLVIYQVTPAPCVPAKNIGMDHEVDFLQSRIKEDRLAIKVRKKISYKILKELSRPLQKLRKFALYDFIEFR